jgi:hypothetical protein
MVLENNIKPTQMGRFLFLQVLKLGIQNCPDILSKFIQTGSYVGYKAYHKVIGFFNATQRRKLAFESWGALKKPQANEVCL